MSEISGEINGILTNVARDWEEHSHSAFRSIETRTKNIDGHIETIAGALIGIASEVHTCVAEVEGYNSMSTTAIDLARALLELKLKGATNPKALEGLQGLRDAYAMVYQTTDNIRTTNGHITEQLQDTTQSLIDFLGGIGMRLAISLLDHNDMEQLATPAESGESPYVDVEPFRHVNDTLEKALDNLKDYGDSI